MRGHNKAMNRSEFHCGFSERVSSLAILALSSLIALARSLGYLVVMPAKRSGF